MRTPRGGSVIGVLALVSCMASPEAAVPHAGMSLTDCGDTSNDPYHCGACDHTCWGGGPMAPMPNMCIEGRCQPLRLQAEPTVMRGSIVAGVNFARHLDRYLDAELQAPFPLQGGLGQSLTVHGTSILATGPAGISSCDVDGCPSGPMLVVSDVLSATDRVGPTAVDANAGVVVYSMPWAGIDMPAVIRAAALDGSMGPHTIYTSPTLGPMIPNLATDGTYLAFIEGDDLRLCEVLDCQATVRSVGTMLVSFYPYIENVLALADGYVAWREYTIDNHNEAARIRWCEASSCADAAELLRTDAAITGVAISDGFVYVGAHGAPGLARCPLSTGCGGAPEPVPWLAGAAGGVTSSLFVSPAFFVIDGQMVAR